MQGLEMSWVAPGWRALVEGASWRYGWRVEGKGLTFPLGNGAVAGLLTGIGGQSQLEVREVRKLKVVQLRRQFLLETG